MRRYIFAILFSMASIVFCDSIDDEIASIDISVPEIEISEINVEEVQVEEVSVPDQIEVVDVSEDIDYMSTIPQIKTINGYVQYDKSIYDYDEMLQEWNQIFIKNKSYDLAEIKLNGRRRVICEAKVSNELDIYTLIDNLAYYQKNKYDTVLLTFDSNSNKDTGLKIINEIEKRGMKIWLAYVESNNVFYILMDPDKLYDLISSFAPHCEAYVSGWRYTSVHIVEQPPEFINYVCKILRNANKDICIFGEIYKGKNANNNYESSNIKNGMSGATIVNFDKGKTNRKVALSYVKEKYECDIVAVVCGYSGFLMNYPNGLTFKENLKNHRKLEMEFLTNDCIATMTLSDDGSDESYKLGLMDISKTPYFNLESNNFNK